MNTKSKTSKAAASAAVFILLGVFASSLFAQTPTPHPVNLTDTNVFKTGSNLPAVLRAIDDGHGAYVPAFILVDTNGDPVSLGGGGDATAANQATQITAEQAILAAIGATNGAAVTTNANGTIQQYLRGLVTLWIAGLPAGSNVIGKFGIDQTTPGTTNAVQLTGAQLTIAESVVSSGATIPAGKFHIEFIFDVDFVGTINGVAYSYANDRWKEYDAPPGRTFAAVTYTISAGSARLTTW